MIIARTHLLHERPLQPSTQIHDVVRAQPASLDAEPANHAHERRIKRTQNLLDLRLGQLGSEVDLDTALQTRDAKLKDRAEVVRQGRESEARRHGASRTRARRTTWASVTRSVQKVKMMGIGRPFSVIVVGVGSEERGEDECGFGDHCCLGNGSLTTLLTDVARARSYASDQQPTRTTSDSSSSELVRAPSIPTAGTGRQLQTSARVHVCHGGSAMLPHARGGPKAKTCRLRSRVMQQSFMPCAGKTKLL
ncbi:hypothetical protein BDZ88DRAFT_442652 [Geranomyces variabilis]|nr:hypothetical protein BDZ88DRAFT_442652 [Geranomyces variabilis]